MLHPLLRQFVLGFFVSLVMSVAVSLSLKWQEGLRVYVSACVSATRCGREGQAVNMYAAEECMCERESAHDITARSEARLRSGFGGVTTSRIEVERPSERLWAPQATISVKDGNCKPFPAGRLAKKESAHRKRQKSCGPNTC